MPYEIISDAEGCSGFAVVKEGEKMPIDGGCHATKEEAQAHYVALEAVYEEEEHENEENSKPIPLELEPEEEAMEYESRAVDISAPEFMRSSARRGIRLHEEGYSGDGLKPQTVEDARAMASGTITERKWRKIAPWIARHIVDLDAVGEGEITAGLVAMLLWGGGSSKESARRAQSYAERVVAKLDERNLKWIDEAIKERDNSMTTNEIEVRWVTKSDNENRSVAYTNLELRAEGEGSTLVGYASIFDSPSEPMPFVEYVKRGAFTKTIKDGADVRLLIDHEGVPLARTKSGTLSLQEDERGLRVEANLDPSNPDAARVMSALKRGDLSQMSFAFRTIKDSWNSDRTVRELREVQLYDVSVVTYPAYESTVAELRTANETTNIEPSSFTRLRSKEVARARISQPK